MFKNQRTKKGDGLKQKEECSSDEKTSALLAKQIDFLPEEVEAMQRLLKTTRDMLHFYLNEFGLHLEKQQQEELARLSSKSDFLILKTARLCFEMKSLECEAKKSLETKKSFAPDKKQTKELAAEITETKNALLELNKRVTNIVEKMKELSKGE